MSFRQDLRNDKGKLKASDLKKLAKKYGMTNEEAYKRAKKRGANFHNSAHQYQASGGGGGQPQTSSYPEVQPGAGATAPGQKPPEQSHNYNQSAPEPAPAVQNNQTKPEMTLGQAIEADKGKLKAKEIEALAEQYGVKTKKVVKKAEKKGVELGGKALENIQNNQQKPEMTLGQAIEADKGKLKAKEIEALAEQYGVKTKKVVKKAEKKDKELGGKALENLGISDTPTEPKPEAEPENAPPAEDQGQNQQELQQKQQAHEQQLQTERLTAEKAEADAQRTHEAQMNSEQLATQTQMNNEQIAQNQRMSRADARERAQNVRKQKKEEMGAQFSNLGTGQTSFQTKQRNKKDIFQQYDFRR
jgi:hypothetical protein